METIKRLVNRILCFFFGHVWLAPNASCLHCEKRRLREKG